MHVIYKSMMYGKVFLYFGAALPFLWGLAHLFATRSVVRGVGDISRDNGIIIAMEWIVSDLLFGKDNL